jgi:hypothetical protein
MLSHIDIIRLLIKVRRFITKGAQFFYFIKEIKIIMTSVYISSPVRVDFDKTGVDIRTSSVMSLEFPNTLQWKM